MLGTVSFHCKKLGQSELPNEDRIVNILRVNSPKNFTVSSLFERTNSLLRPAFESGLKLTFVKSDIKGKEVEIAASFHAKQIRRAPGVPTMLVSLVNNDNADVLATGLYFEARGQADLAQVILNRVRKQAYSSTICGVVYQNDGWFSRC